MIGAGCNDPEFYGCVKCYTSKNMKKGLVLVTSYLGAVPIYFYLELSYSIETHF